MLETLKPLVKAIGSNFKLNLSLNQVNKAMLTLPQ